MKRILFPRGSHENGFTAIELLVTIIVTALFAISFYQLFISVNQATSLARNRATASDIAYAKLRKYAAAEVTPADWSPAFTCSMLSGSSNTNDLSVNSNAAGTTLESGNLVSTDVNLPTPITYSVVALAVYGCSGTNINKPLRVVSTVTFGPQNTVIKHGTLVGY